MPPKQLAWCAHCNAPIYMERVAGACTCAEGALRALQLDIQHRQAARPTGTAAATVIGTPRHAEDLSRILMADARRELGLSEESEHMERQIRAGLGVPEPLVRPANCPPASRPMNLEDLWSTPETGDIDFAPAPDDGLGIEFDEMPMDEVGPRPTGDREATRFRVDRGAPQREPFRGNVEAGPQGGPMRQVGTVRGFAVLREQRLRGETEPRYYEPPSPPEDFGRLPRQEAVAFRNEINQQAAPKPTKPTGPRPTVYDRIKKGFLDDD